MITVVKLEAKHAGSINQFCLRKVLFKVKLTLSAPKRVRIEDCKLIFLSYFLLNMIQNGILSVFFVEFIFFL